MRQLATRAFTMFLLVVLAGCGTHSIYDPYSYYTKSGHLVASNDVPHGKLILVDRMSLQRVNGEFVRNRLDYGILDWNEFCLTPGTHTLTLYKVERRDLNPVTVGDPIDLTVTVVDGSTTKIAGWPPAVLPP